nr:MAG TPA: hypothetical protein [Caudoviricetes sp.]
MNVAKAEKSIKIAQGQILNAEIMDNQQPSFSVYICKLCQLII